MRFWTRLRYNGVTIAAHCAIKGHEWRQENVGVIGLEITTCAWCGKYRGYRQTRDQLFVTRRENIRPGYGRVHLDPIPEETPCTFGQLDCRYWPRTDTTGTTEGAEKP